MTYGFIIFDHLRSGVLYIIGGVCMYVGLYLYVSVCMYVCL